jgi:hypothetical protein
MGSAGGICFLPGARRAAETLDAAAESSPQSTLGAVASTPIHTTVQLAVMDATERKGRADVCDFLKGIEQGEFTADVVASFLEASFAPVQWRIELESMKAEEGQLALFLQLAKKNFAG